MAVLSISDLAVEFGVTTLFRDVTLTVEAGERWGIVGRNGSGKSTLFQLVAGAMEPTRGTIAKAPGLRVALLDQYRDFGDALTLWDAVARPYRPLMELEKELARQGERLATLGDAVTEADLDRYGRDQDRFSHGGGYEFHARVDAVLQGLAFDPEDAKTRLVATLSGGERGRAGLAAQLAAPADVVLLDEPTNHLDLPTTDWLRQYLGELGETVLVISHDRAFLDDTVDHVLHLSGATGATYRGGYSSFVTQRAERQMAQERAVAQQRRVIAKEEDYIRRNIAGRNSAQAKGRRDKLSRLPRLSPPPGEADAMALTLTAAGRSGDQALVAENVTVTVGERTLVEEFTAVARRGETIALVGPNGAGKSTLLATLLGSREPAAGTVRLGGSVSAEWFRQDLAQVPADRAIYDCIADLRPSWTRGAIQNHLGCFGFSGDDVRRSTAVCSGGERARVALALLTLRQANLLVLDEPTNHLDVESIEVLEDAIEEYEGTVLLVSHDRAFLRELATRVWAFDGTRIEDYGGTFVEWEQHASERAGKRVAREAEAQAGRRAEEKAKGERSAAAARAGEDAKRARKREAASREAAVVSAEARVAELERALADPALYDGKGDGARKAGRLDAELREARRRLEAAMEKWSELSE